MSAQIMPCPWHDDNHDNPPMLETQELPAIGSAYHFIECNDCGAKGPNCATKREAIAAWERRAKLEQSDA